MRRRRFLRRTGAGLAGVVATAGCIGDGGGDTPTEGTAAEDTPTDGDGSTDSPTEGTGTTENATTGTPNGDATLTVATYDSFVGEDTAGNWLKGAFESEYPEATVEFLTPENGVNEYIQRAQQGAQIEPDLFVGLNTGELVRVDEQLDDQLFQPVEDDIERSGEIKETLRIDPEGRAVAYDTGYISLVYDEDEVENPDSFDTLLEPAYEDALIAQNAQSSDPGEAFLLWSIIAKGEDSYLDYWEGLVDNGVTIMSDWNPSYQAYQDGEAPMVVSYSTDQVYYHGPDVDMSRHQVAFLNDQGYANPETMALFSDADDPDLARTFMNFVLTDEAQAEIAVNNVQFPAVEGVDPGEEYSQYAYEPPEPVTHSYDELSGNVGTWIEDWARQVATK